MPPEKPEKKNQTIVTTDTTYLSYLTRWCIAAFSSQKPCTTSITNWNYFKQTVKKQQNWVCVATTGFCLLVGLLFLFDGTLILLLPQHQIFIIFIIFESLAKQPLLVSNLDNTDTNATLNTPRNT